MTADDLERYGDAWNAHDIDSIMAIMTEDCIFETAGGPAAWGTRFVGAEIVRNRFVQVWRDITNARWENATHFAEGNHGCSAWTFRGTGSDEAAIELEGCDLFVFRGPRIWKKSTFLKNRR